jgi:diguanylate cyclase (GGDEF)-like protein
VPPDSPRLRTLLTQGRTRQRLPRQLVYAAWALVLAAGAPAGLLAVRLASGRASVRGLAEEWAADATTYLYVTASTALVFALFGSALGRRADALARLATIDGLTGLLNRRALTDRLESEIRRAQRHPEPLAVLAIDLDGLKRINDGHGHEAGDAALRRVSDALRSVCRVSDIVGRWGGDEFLLVAPGGSSADARRVAERVREAVAAQSGGLPLSVSIGIATLAGHEPSLQAIVRRADDALYEAKRRGRNQVAASD